MVLPAFTCPICSQPLERRAVSAVCLYCGVEDGPGEPGAPPPWRCPSGHYICPECRSAQASDVITRSVGHLDAWSPIRIADLLMSHPAFRQEAYGPDHHGIPAFAVLSALRGASLWDGSNARILAAVRRARSVPSGSCYLSGSCGACAAAGAAVSTVLGLDIRDRRRGEALQAVALCTGSLADTGGLRCCKEAVYASIQAVLKVLASSLAIPAELRESEVRCSFHSDLKDCKGPTCPYHPDHKPLRGAGSSFPEGARP
ncbi:MAG: hypothetical protein GX430_15220 [Treponema sp.]|nr:hypothetical protein [Treponema sp.]